LDDNGIVRLHLVPEDIAVLQGRQIDLWQKVSTTEARIERALVRVQGMLGEEGVSTAVLGGGRDPREQAQSIPWGRTREPALPGRPTVSVESMPSSDRLGMALVASASGRRRASAEIPVWPGRLPGAAPATIFRERRPVRVVDVDGQPVSVSGRGVLQSEPSRFGLQGEALQPLLAWAGPWLLEERWWDVHRRRRCARFQLVGTSAAYLVVLEKGTWWIEACYD
jgi:protein ImuB